MRAALSSVHWGREYTSQWTLLETFLDGGLWPRSSVLMPSTVPGLSLRLHQRWRMNEH